MREPWTRGSFFLGGGAGYMLQDRHTGDNILLLATRPCVSCASGSCVFPPFKTHVAPNVNKTGSHVWHEGEL